jgi:hypothetical protein
MQFYILLWNSIIGRWEAKVEMSEINAVIYDEKDPLKEIYIAYNIFFQRNAI